MNRKGTKVNVVAATLLLIISGVAAADHSRPRDVPVYDYAKVLSAQPVIHYVTVKAPVEKCWQETAHYTTYHRPPHATGRTLVGAVIGGVIGHQFGSGRGNDAATVAGTLIGAAIGHNSAVHRGGAGYGYVRTSHPVERCKTVYRDRREERIDGYDVVYRYKGQKYATRMPYDPGNRIKVRIDIRPAA